MPDFTAAHGTHTEHGRPKGSTSLTPHLVVGDARAAIAFYQAVFGARALDVTEMGGLIGHATLALDLGRFTLSDALPSFALVAPTPGPVSASFAIYVSDVDAVVERALAAGATLREPIASFVSGDRYASIIDPFHVRWAVMTRIEDLSDEESAARVARWAAEQGG
jgi:PhnB protein